MPHPQIRANLLLAAVEDHAMWQGGSGSEWECDAIVGAGFLEALTKLAARAPYSEKRKFLKEIGFVRS